MAELYRRRPGKGWFPVHKTMSTISIAITSCSNETATLKVLRSYTTTSLGRLRQVIGTHEPASIFRQWRIR